MTLLKRHFFGEAGEDSGSLSGRVFGFAEIPTVRGQKERMASDIKIRYGENLMLFRSHREDSILGKYPKTMKLERKEDGLYFKASPLETDFFKETRSLVKSGVLSGVSAGFYALRSVMEGGIKIFKEIQLEEISLCAKPAYGSSFVEARKKETDFKPLPPELYL